MLDVVDVTEADFDDDDQNDNLFTVGRKMKIDIADMDYTSWLQELIADRDNLELLSLMVQDITPAHDTKLQTLFECIDTKLVHPINEGNRKIIIFTAFADTADYLYQQVSAYVLRKYNMQTAEITVLEEPLPEPELAVTGSLIPKDLSDDAAVCGELRRQSEPSPTSPNSLFCETKIHIEARCKANSCYCRISHQMISL